jgi:hypothetical protein
VVDSVISYRNFQSLGNIIWLKWSKVHQTRHIIWKFLKSWQYHVALGHTIDHTEEAFGLFLVRYNRIGPFFGS